MNTPSNIRRRKYVCRFAAGHDGFAQSGIWRVWSARNSPALFAAVDAIGEVKATVHCPDARKPTWKRHYGFDFNAKGDVADAIKAEGSGRHKATWAGANIGQGRTIEWRIIIPGGALSLTPTKVTPDIQLLPSPNEAQWLVIAVILGSPISPQDYPKAKDADTHLLSEGALCDGHRIWITYCYVPARPIAAPANTRPRFFGSPDHIRSVPRELRASAIADNSDGSLVFWDFRVDNLTTTSP